MSTTQIRGTNARGEHRTNKLGFRSTPEYGRYVKPLRGARGGTISSCAGGYEAA
jgi:hypothetical protein